jgi:hypothetical protein
MLEKLSSQTFSKAHAIHSPKHLDDDTLLRNDHTLKVWLKADVGVEADAKGM